MTPGGVPLLSFRRFLLGSAVGHAVLLGILVLAPSLPRASLRPAPVYVDLVALSKPAPAVEKPKRSRQKVDQAVVLKPKPKRKPKPRPRLKPKPAPAETPAVPAPSAAEVMAKLRAQVGQESSPEPERRAGRAGRFDPLLAAYQRQIRILLRGNWGGGASFKDQAGLMVRFEVALTAHGTLRSMTRVRSSGNSYFDQAAERAIRSSAFPAPPRGPITLDLVFNPEGIVSGGPL
ncbi:MAG: TonB family protein [Myxococcota bacterium]